MRIFRALILLLLLTGCATKSAPPAPPPPPLCDPARYPDRKLPLETALGGGEVKAGPFTFCLLAYTDPAIQGEGAEVDLAHMSDLPGVGWTAVWRYDGPTFTGAVTADAGALPEALRGIFNAGGLKSGDTGGQDAAGLLVSPFPLPDRRRQLGIRVVTPDGTHGARLAFQVAGGTVKDIAVLPWDENALWPAITTVPSPAGGAAVSVGAQLSLLDQTGRTTMTHDLGSPLLTFTWAPSGRQAIATTADDRLWRVDAAAGKVEPLNPGTPPDTALMAAWSPDETRLLLGRNWGVRGGGTWESQVWLYSFQDGSLRELGSHERLTRLYWLEPAYALVHSYQGGGHSSLERRRVDTWAEVSAVDGSGSLAPNGKTTVVTPWEAPQLTLVNVDTGVGQTVWKDRPPGAPVGAYAVGPLVWAPDSRRFAYRVTERSGGPDTLRMSDISGSDRQVAEHPAGWFGWQPQPGGALLYGETNGNAVTVKLGQTTLGSVETARELGNIAFTPDGARAAVAVIGTGSDNALWLTVAEANPPAVRPVLNGKDLSPIMWLGDKLLAQEWPYYHHVTSAGRAVKALWLVDPETGERTPVPGKPAGTAQQLCDPARYPGHKPPLGASLGGGELRGTYGARLAFRVVDGGVADVTLAPWD